MSDFLKIGELKENLIKLIEAKFELTKLNVQDKIEGIVVKVAYALITFILGIVVIIFLSILIALGLNHLIGSSWLGFLIMFGFYILILAQSLLLILMLILIPIHSFEWQPQGYSPA